MKQPSGHDGYLCSEMLTAKLPVPKSFLSEGPAHSYKLNGRPFPLKEPLSVFCNVFLGTFVRMRMGSGSFRDKVALFACPQSPLPFRRYLQDRSVLCVFADLGGG